MTLIEMSDIDEVCERAQEIFVGLTEAIEQAEGALSNAKKQIAELEASLIKVVFELELEIRKAE